MKGYTITIGNSAPTKFGVNIHLFFACLVAALPAAFWDVDHRMFVF